MALVDEEAARRKWSRNVTLVTALEYGLPDMMREVVGGGKNAARENQESGQETIIPEVGKVGSENGSVGIKGGGTRRKAGFIRAQETIEAGAVKFRGIGKCPHGYMNWMVCRDESGGCE